MVWIQGDLFEKIGDSTYSPGIKITADYSNLPCDFSLEKLKDVNVVYTHTFYAKQLFDVIAPMKEKFVIVTHNSDAPVDFIPPDNVIKWFTTNVSIEDERIESIPLGLENSRWVPEIGKLAKLQDKLSDNKVLRNTVYMNHNIDTNPAEREKPYNIFKDKSWVTTDMGLNGSRFDEYLDNIYNHQFMICPAGSGLDTHRTWECLYVNTIPIEKRNINNQYYTDLPILFVDDWEEITEEFLYSSYNKIADATWNLKKLDFEYWKDKIWALHTK